MLKHLISLFRLNMDKSYKQVYIRKIAENNSPLGTDYTLLLQLMGQDTFIPVNLPFNSGQNIIMVSEKKFHARPHVYDTLRRTIYGLGAVPKAVLIAMYSAGVFYTFIQVEKNNQLLEIDVKFSDAISLAVACGIPILIENNLSKILGIDVDPEMEMINSNPADI